MFFTRLRTHAKWVFVLLAVFFAVGFVAFGVGAGGTGFGDAISDFFGGGEDLPSLEEAQQKVDENPNDAAAVLALANAFQSERQYGQAAKQLERYAELRPEDADVLRQLAAVYSNQANTVASEAGQDAVPAQVFGQNAFLFPTSNGFLGALGQDPIGNALGNQAEVARQDASQEVSAIYAKQAAVYEQLAGLTPDDPQVYLQLATASQSAGDNEQAVTAYERFLELSPDDPLAKQVQEQIDLLKGDVENTTG